VSWRGSELRRLLSVEGKLRTEAVSVGLLASELNDAHLVNLVELSNTIGRCEGLGFRFRLRRAIFHFANSQSVG
jgi:hypothetical protein